MLRSGPITRTAAVLALALAATAAGCGGTRFTHFRPAGDYQAAGTGWVAKRIYTLPPETGQVKVEIAARGRTATNDKGVEYESLNVRFRIANRGEAAFTLKPADVRLLDDEGHRVQGAEGYAGRDRTGAITVAGGADATYELVFDLPTGTDLKNLGSVRIQWPYQVGDTRDTVTTKFLRIEDVYYYTPGYYYPYHPYYPYYYHDPWYYDYWYGPFPRHRVGAGFYGRW